MKSRSQKEEEYQLKYGHIPIQFNDRIEWMVDYYHLSPQKMEEIIAKRDNMLTNLFYYDYKVIEFMEEPVGQARPRVRVLRSNYNQLALHNNQMIHVYVPGAGDDRNYMRRLIDSELLHIDSLIFTPCDIEYNVFLRTPSTINTTDKFLCEIGLIRPPFAKPDWDNIAKKYSDMFNYNIWMDDTLVIDGTIHKYYSILPRVEIKLRYLNCVYTRKFYDTMSQRKGFPYNGELHYLNSKGELV